jgi:hypothetical protein
VPDGSKSYFAALPSQLLLGSLTFTPLTGIFRILGFRQSGKSKEACLLCILEIKGEYGELRWFVKE